jgi:long-chain acyl-CoA synthetase
MEKTIGSHFFENVANSPNQVWLRDLAGRKEDVREWTWGQAQIEVNKMCAWLQRKIGTSGCAIGLLSRNCAHWVMADLAVITSGNVTVPLFTSSSTDIVNYVVSFAEVKVLFLGESDNWSEIKSNIDRSVVIVTLPGFKPEWEDGDLHNYVRWNDIIESEVMLKAMHHAKPTDVVSIIFTSGTTGMPKGVVQSHESMLMPTYRHNGVYPLRPSPVFISYLPLAHIAERQLVFVQSLIIGAEINFNEALAYLVRDMSVCRPNFFFGAPRVWEQLMQGVVSKFGSHEAVESALESGGQDVRIKIVESLGLQDSDLLAVGSAPARRELLEWFDSLGLKVLEGYGQTEAMGMSGNTIDGNRSGSIGKPYPGVEFRISSAGELVCKAEGLAVGYFNAPGDTAKTFINGCVHTGDLGEVDSEGYYYLTGRIKDYFKTIQGKFVSPYPIESAFSGSDVVQQLCLLGRGYSKTVMVCVISDAAKAMSKELVERELVSTIGKINEGLERHMRMGGAILTVESWTTCNTVLTPTLKVRRDKVESLYGVEAEILARRSAETKSIIIRWS